MPENIDDFLGGGNISYPVKKSARAENEVELAGKFLSSLLDDPVKIDDFVIQVIDYFARSPLFAGKINSPAAEERFDISRNVARNHRHYVRSESFLSADIRKEVVDRNNFGHITSYECSCAIFAKIIPFISAASIACVPA